MSGSLPCFSHISASHNLGPLRITLLIFLCRSINTLMPSNLMTLTMNSARSSVAKGCMYRPVPTIRTTAAAAARLESRGVIPEASAWQALLQRYDIVFRFTIPEGGPQQGRSILHVLHLTLRLRIARDLGLHGSARLRGQFAIREGNEQFVSQFDHRFSVPGLATGCGIRRPVGRAFPIVTVLNVAVLSVAVLS